ncbi:MAG: hypothetical protein AAFV88_09550 [Planctomycetota bacterium]
MFFSSKDQNNAMISIESPSICVRNDDAVRSGVLGNLVIKTYDMPGRLSLGTSLTEDAGLGPAVRRFDGGHPSASHFDPKTMTARSHNGE